MIEKNPLAPVSGQDVTDWKARADRPDKTTAEKCQSPFWSTRIISTDSCAEKVIPPTVTPVDNEARLP